MLIPSKVLLPTAFMPAFDIWLLGLSKTCSMYCTIFFETPQSAFLSKNPNGIVILHSKLVKTHPQHPPQSL